MLNEYGPEIFPTVEKNNGRSEEWKPETSNEGAV